MDIARNKKARKISKRFGNGKPDVQYPVHFSLHIAPRINSPEVVADERIDKVVGDLEANAPEIVRDGHQVPDISPPPSMVAQRGQDFALVVIVKDHLVSDEPEVSTSSVRVRAMPLS